MNIKQFRDKFWSSLNYETQGRNHSFLGTNCDRDAKSALDSLGFKTEFIFHTEKNLKKYDLIVLPGGFSFGDYIRAGRLAKLSPAVLAIKDLKTKVSKGFILGNLQWFSNINGIRAFCQVL